MLSLSLVSCGSDYLDTEYTTYLSAEAAGEAAGNNPDVFLNGMWSYMVDMYSSSHDAFNYMSVMLSTDAMAEDMAFGALHWFSYDYQFDNRMYNYRRTAVNWSLFYTEISKSNEIIALYPNGPQTDGEKALLGQAYAMRGFSYYYLIQLYQNCVKADGSLNTTAKGVPMYYASTEGLSDEEQTTRKGRNTVALVFEQIESDLTNAVSLLNESGYERPSKNYIDAGVANGMLARYYLLTQQWQKAANAANAARQGYSIMGNAGLHDGFMDVTNEEWMWGFDQSTETSTIYASFFSHISNIAPGYAGLGYSPKLIDARLYSQIPDDDYRKSLFNGPNGDSSQSSTGAKYPYANLKFGNDGNWTMDYPYMRAAEMVLIEAEAYARLGENAKAAQVLAVLMANRQPSWSKASVSVDEILLQRRIELWGEGFSYFDLKRLNKGIDRNYSGSNHYTGCKLTVSAQDANWTYQIPRSEMQENKQLTADDQND